MHRRVMGHVQFIIFLVFVLPPTPLKIEFGVELLPLAAKTWTWRNFMLILIEGFCWLPRGLFFLDWEDTEFKEEEILF